MVKLQNPNEAGLSIDAGVVDDAVRSLDSRALDLAALSGLQDDELDAYYAQARRLTERGLHEKAMMALCALTLLRPGRAHYHRALGLACHRACKYVPARMAYRNALTIDPEDDITALLAAECELYLAGPAAGVATLRDALARATSRPSVAEEVKTYIDRAQAILEVVGTAPASNGTTSRGADSGSVATAAPPATRGRGV